MYISMDHEAIIALALLRGEVELAEILSEGHETQRDSRMEAFVLNKWLGKGLFRVSDRGSHVPVEARGI